MVIGFSERFQTVLESDFPVQHFGLQVDIITLRTAEKEYHMDIYVEEYSSTATVGPYNETNSHIDVNFASRNNPDDPLTWHVSVPPGTSIIDPVTVFIRDDVIPEDEECFTLRIFPSDIPGTRDVFTCNVDAADAMSYFCFHTICITDDDGKKLNQ